MAPIVCLNNAESLAIAFISLVITPETLDIALYEAVALSAVTPSLAISVDIDDMSFSIPGSISRVKPNSSLIPWADLYTLPKNSNDFINISNNPAAIVAMPANVVIPIERPFPI